MIAHGQINCDSCAILKQSFITNGDSVSYRNYYKYCSKSINDTLYLDLNDNLTFKSLAYRYKIIKSDKCIDHKFYSIFNFKNNEYITSFETYNNDTVYMNIDTIADFHFESEYFRNYNTSFKISHETLENSEGGTVYISMIILQNGKIDCIEILRSKDKYLNSDALKFVAHMPNWSPGIKNGKKVICRVNYPFKVNID